MLNWQTSGVVYDENGNKLTVKRAFANVNASQTDAAIIAAVTAKKLRILWIIALCDATATAFTLNSKGAGAGTAISSAIPNGANGGELAAVNPFGYFETASGEGLSVTTGAGSATGFNVGYIEV